MSKARGGKSGGDATDDVVARLRDIEQAESRSTKVRRTCDPTGVERKSTSKTPGTQHQDQFSGLTLPTLAEAGVSRKSTQHAWRSLNQLTAAEGVSLAELAAVGGFASAEELSDLPLISVRVAAQFLDLSRQRVHILLRQFGLGCRFAGDLRLSVNELLRLRLIPRDVGVHQSKTAQPSK